ncbi:MAG: hypothetical protein WA985_00675, partial [Erythrobacter sp.]
MTASALVLGMSAHGAAFAQDRQSSPGTFTLPEGDPTPTPRPQGPVDERAGVPIAPRVITR